MFNKKFYTILAILLFSVILWQCPAPQGLNKDGWHLLIIFTSTILGVIFSVAKMGVVTIIGLIVLVLTDTLSIGKALSGFKSSTVWLVVLAFFTARGFVKTGLGRRVAYMMISKFGNSLTGLSYSLIYTEFLISPMIPSVVARGGGIIYPIVQSLINAYSGSHEKKETEKIGAFLVQLCFQSNIITSALFLTAMAANPLIVSIASNFGIKITWSSWFISAIIPGIICLALLPMILFKLIKPVESNLNAAPKIAREELKKMGKITKPEYIMISTLVLMIVLWIIGDKIGVDATTVAFLGFIILVVTRVLDWDETISQKSAWETLIWFSILLMMSTFLTDYGVTGWLGDKIRYLFAETDKMLVFISLLAIFFFLHYLFASISAYVTVMYGTFLSVLLNIGIPTEIAAMSLAFVAILSGGITHFSIGSAPMFFSTRYISTLNWWKLGFIINAFNVILFLTLAIGWWKIIGLW